jgi:putative flippase GtrA
VVLGRFFSVGLACVLLHNAIMIGGDWAGLHYVVSSLISFTLVVLVGYWLHSAWTFPGAERGGMSLARYTLTMALNLPLSIAGMYVFVDLAGIGVPIAAPAVTVLLAVFNFVGGRWALRVKRAQSSRQT